MKSAKFSLFSDLHYRDGNYGDVIGRLETILARAEASHVDFIMHCGDFCHNVRTGKAIIDRYNSFHIPTRHTVGNHDFEQTDGLQCVLDAYGMSSNYYSFDCNGIRMISLDTNYHYSPDGRLLHYADDTAWAKCHQERVVLSPAEVTFLCECVSSAPGPCVIFSHDSPLFHAGLDNGEAVRAALNASRGSRPVLWINGHYHRNVLRLSDGIAWFVINSTTSDWMDIPHHAYPEEIMKKSPCGEHSLLYETPVHAIVTVSEDGTVDIEGMPGRPFMGITPEMIGNSPLNAHGLPFDASVLSAHFRLL